MVIWWLASTAETAVKAARALVLSIDEGFGFSFVVRLPVVLICCDREGVKLAVYEV